MAARAKLAQRFDAVRTGGKGTARRRKLAKHQTNTADEKQLQAHLKRLGLNSIPGIEEVNMFTEDGGVLHFNTPKVQAAVGANTYVITGQPENKRLEELLPGIIHQLGADNLTNLRRIAEGSSRDLGCSVVILNEVEFEVGLWVSPAILSGVRSRIPHSFIFWSL
ncbi:Btf3 [Symbiodinium necroappetens]|uniref:Nascent polypeptide-associated complex subunit beta n=1 Tax=Symbiodinium necroappetens TaxID=1628268 RepID=A0A813BEF0_9DINO|nr:Btf3 [Symbiodinium necroappetens]